MIEPSLHRSTENMRAIAAYQTYKPDPETDLAERRRQLVEQHASMVKRVAIRIMRRLPSGVTVEEHDLFSAGILGLFEAERRFDRSGGFSFETFAEFRVKGAMLDELRRRDFFPRRLRGKANRLKEKTEQLRRELGRDPTDNEVAEVLGLDLKALIKLRADVAPYHFVDSEDVSLSLRSASPNPESLTASSQMRDRLKEKLALLSEREQLVLDQYFNHERTLREIAEILDLTVGRICQIKGEALKKLRKMLSEH